MGQRRDRLDKRIDKQIVTRKKNSLDKAAERLRRDQQMLDLIKRGDFPYTPGIMSWLSVRLGKKAAQITPDDVKALLA
jgi:hypothetical protein